MIKSEIHNIQVSMKNKILKVNLKCCFVLIVTFDNKEKRPEFQCDDFWKMIEKLCKKHKLMSYAPTPSLEENYSLFDVLDIFFTVEYID